MIKTVLKHVLMAGLEHNITIPQENITLKKQKDTKYSNKEY
jgi:hypothetical protein